mgnify:FL=1
METERKPNSILFFISCFFIILRLLYLSYDSLESLRIVNSEVSEDLAVDLDTSLVECTHKCRIGHVLETSSSVDTLDPQCAEVALLVTAVTVSVCETLLPSVLRNCPNILSCTIVTLGQLKDSCSLCF